MLAQHCFNGLALELPRPFLQVVLLLPMQNFAEKEAGVFPTALILMEEILDHADILGSSLSVLAPCDLYQDGTVAHVLVVGTDHSHALIALDLYYRTDFPGSRRIHREALEIDSEADSVLNGKHLMGPFLRFLEHLYVGCSHLEP